MSYQKIVVSKFGGPEVLELVEEQNLPEPDKHQVRVKVLAAGTGFTDTIIREGQYPDNKKKPPFVIGYDWFGVVDKVGSEVKNFKQGDYVADMCVTGGYTQYLVANENEIIAAPEGLDPAEAVAMMLSYSTAYQMIKRIRPIPAGSTCLVHAAGGAVGTALLELGELLDLNIIGTASKSKHHLLEKFGAKAIDYRTEDFVTRTMAITNNKGVDVVFDTIGGSYWSRSYKCLKQGGTLIAYGALQLTTGEEKLPALLWGFFKLLVGWKMIPDGKNSCFFNVQKRRISHPEDFIEDTQQLFQWLKEGKLKPVIADRRPLKDAAEVHKLIDKSDVLGKIVLLPQL